VGETCSTLAGMATQICVPGGASCGDANQPCCAGNACISGLVCGTPAGGTVLICGTAACGTANQPCCAGNMCNSGLVCGTPPGGSGLICGTATATPGPYAGCSPPGAVCSGNTQCMSSIATNSGTAAFCTAGCTGSASMCPPSPNGSVNCYVFNVNGVATGQCFQDCQAGMPCQAGTTCRPVTPVGVAGTVSICTP
jgi:hypothetical protein